MNILIKYLKKKLKNEEKRDWSRLESEVCIFLQGSVFSRFTSISDLKLGTALACSTSKLLFLFHFPLPFLQGMYLPSPARRAQYQAGFHQNFHLPEYALHCRLCCCQTFFSFLEENSKFRREKKKGGEEGRERLQCVQIVLQSRKTAEVVLQSALRKHGTHTGCESPVTRVTVQKKAKCIWDSLFNQFLFHEVKSQ